MTTNTTTLFAYLRKAPFGGRLTQQQIDGLTVILEAWKRSKATDLRWLAYILATAFHETGGTMAPVREGFAKTDAKARKIVAKRAYAEVDRKTGEVYYGRGFVQLTWRGNYVRMGDIVGYDLYGKPDLALEPDIAAAILVEGMIRGKSGKGDFTGKSLDQYFNSAVDDPEGARRIVNGMDKASLIATYHERFLAALQEADTRTPQPPDVMKEDAEPDAPALTTDKTLWGTVTSIIGAGGAGVLGAIDNPWAVLALVVVGIGIILFMTGRLQIRRESGA